MTTGVFTGIKTYLGANRFGDVLVRRGLVSEAQLRDALMVQRREGEALGEILMSSGVISRWDIRTTLAMQTSLRTVMAFTALFVSLTSFAPRPSHAGGMKDIPNSIILASSSTAMAQGVAYGSLFGTGEKKSYDLSAFTKWSDMFDRFQRDASRESTNPILQKWKDNLSDLRGRSLVGMADGVNDLMNRVRYIGDQRNWGRSDYWETPVEFLSRGGDCEDFAIAKYASLRALGVPENLLRIAIVKDMEKNIPHAILIVYTEEGPMVLDNQIKRMTRASSISHYKPIFSINRDAWWVHTDQLNRGDTQIATASR